VFLLSSVPPEAAWTKRALLIGIASVVNASPGIEQQRIGWRYRSGRFARYAGTCYLSHIKVVTNRLAAIKTLNSGARASAH